MKTLKIYLEEIQNADIISGIRQVESALSFLYKIADYISKNPNNQQILIRQIESINKILLKASGFFGIQEYTGNPVKANMTDTVNNAIASLSKILTAYNNGLDDPIGWAKICMDLVATLTESHNEEIK